MNLKIDIETVLSQYSPLIARIAATHESNVSLQEDLLQDISLAVWRALETYRGDASIKTFIARIAHNRGVDHVIREAKRNQGINHEVIVDELISQHSVSVLQGQKNDMQIDLMTALHRLSLGHRQVITMQLEGFTHAEVATVLGINETAVAKRAARARQQLEIFFKQAASNCAKG